MKQNLRRAHPTATDGEIELLLGNWLRQRPGVENGEADGVAVPWP